MLSRMRSSLRQTWSLNDEVTHHSGPSGRDTRQILARLDRSLALLSRVAEARAPGVPDRAALGPRPEPRRDLPRKSTG
ncbi:hypothetical protein SSAG_01828 [Streptomyces sp. Mg1]|nr:hypothetical protein SSAG_01828 [Streptomyces sp. Mg1]